MNTALDSAEAKTNGFGSVARLLSVIRRYRTTILVAFAAIAVAYGLFMSVLLLLTPSRRVASLEFRLEFDGATGVYPNGTRFTTADIVATPVLRTVYDANELDDYLSFNDFSRSVFILGTNREFESLNQQYAARLRDPRLSTVDRERIEREYQEKLQSISKHDYSINLVTAKAFTRIPPAVSHKVITDVLAEWARQSEVEKKVLLHAVPVLSANILRDPSNDGDLVVRTLILRQRLGAVISNLEQIEDIPGADMMRTAKEKASLAEIRLQLNELIRFDVESLVAAAAGLPGARERAVSVLESQIEYDQRMLNTARARESALRNTFLTYEQQTQQTSTAATRDLTEDTPPTAPGVTTQLSETFLDRIVDLANRATDLHFRQSLANEIKSAALAIGPAEAAVLTDQALLARIRQLPPPAMSTQQVQARYDVLNQRVENAIRQLNEIYLSASRQLNAQSALFTVTSPAGSVVERAISIEHAAIGGVALLFLSIPIVIGSCVIHNRMRD